MKQIWQYIKAHPLTSVAGGLTLVFCAYSVLFRHHEVDTDTIGLFLTGLGLVIASDPNFLKRNI